MKTVDPDKTFRNLDDERQYKYLLLDGPLAEDLFSKHYLDLELDPYQIFCIKMLRGRFHHESEIYQFLEENEMDWMFENGWIRHGNNSGISPYYWDVPNVLILWPAGFGKTTVVSTRVIPVMEICDNPNIRLQYIGKNETEAFSFSTSIRRELTNTKLVKDFGDFRPKDKNVPWTLQAFSVDQRQWRDVRENFEFFGTNSHAELGKRCDQAYLDDVETPDTARTPDMRDKFLEWVRIGPFTAPRPIWPRDGMGRIMRPKNIKWSNTARYFGKGVVGTIFHPEAFYAMLMRDPTFTCIKFDCFKDKKMSISLSNKMMDVPMLERERRSIGILAFNKRYRNIAYNEEEMAFREVWVRGGEEEINNQRVHHIGCLDRSRKFTMVDDDWELYGGFDPASGSKSRWSAYSAYVILGIDPRDEQRRVYLVDFAKIQDNFDRMLDWLLDGNPQYAIEGFYTKYQYKKCSVEENAFGKWLLNNDRMKPWLDKHIVVPVHTTGQNKNDPEAGVFSMGAMIQDGRFHIPYSEASDQDKAETFIADMLLYPKGTNDLIMALWLAMQNIGTDLPQYQSFVSKKDRVRWFKNPAFQ